MTSLSSASQDFLVGQLLIAMPNMGDPRFERSVVLICTHDADHAMGVVLNKRLDDVDFFDLLEQLDIPPRDERGDEPGVYFGGPVQTERGLVLHTDDYQSDGTMTISETVSLTANKEILVDIAGAQPVQPAPRRFLLMIGHAGWGAGQLEAEIAMNAWAHCDLDEDLIFGGGSTDTWERALAKLGVTSAMLSPEWFAGQNDDQPLN